MEQIRKALSLSDCRLSFKGKGEDTTGQFEGYASVFGGNDSYGDTIHPGAFADTLKNHATPKMFLNHRAWELPVGKWLSLEEDTTGLLVRGELTVGMRAADDLRAAMKHETVDGLSIGFLLGSEDFEWKQGMEGRDIYRVSELIEISPVTFPADGAARISADSVKGALDQIQTITDFEHFLRDSGAFSKGLATALASRAREIFRRDAGESNEAKAVKEIGNILKSFKLPDFGVGA